MSGYIYQQQRSFFFLSFFLGGGVDGEEDKYLEPLCSLQKLGKLVLEIERQIYLPGAGVKGGG
jgi:hypothetical protein